MSSEESKPFAWVAYYSDFSSAVVFDNELDALRHAVAGSMLCDALTSGEEIGRKRP